MPSFRKDASENQDKCLGTTLSMAPPPSSLKTLLESFDRKISEFFSVFSSYRTAFLRLHGAALTVASQIYV